jgi:Uma2 family endonuclease
MNAHVTVPAAPPSPTESRPHRFTVDDLYAMMKAGVIEEGAHEELIEGELIEMPADGARHKKLSHDLMFWLARGLDPSAYIVIPSSTLVLSDLNAPSPDWCVTPAGIPIADVRGPDTLLVIEQAESSTRRDLGWKADLYARYGVRDYWVIDIDKRETHVHRDPTENGYGFRQRHPADSEVAALLVPGLSLRLSTLG